MKKLFYLFVFILSVVINYGQTAPGDTIFIKTLKYGSTTRDTLINFPNNAFTFEKIIMKYNMRCKNALISTQSSPNQGCGEWDYSCNTYIVDSSKVENAAKTHPEYLISNFTGTTFPYVNHQLYDYYDYLQEDVTIGGITSENQYTVGIGSLAAQNVLEPNNKSGRSQILITAAELLATTLTAGNIHGMILNVANPGGDVNFFKIKMKHVVASALSSSSLNLTGFTEVHNKNYSFVFGDNRIQFHTPFNWDGVSDVLIDLSFTNTIPNSPIIFNGHTNAGVVALYAQNNYALNLEAFGQATVNTSMLNTITNEITISLWAYGNAALLPANTSLMEGWASNPNQRQLNIHLPWSNSNVYFDAGYAAGGYDRINKLAAANENAGQWNHWAFTKNATSGDMKIYLNGVLWQSGTAKTKAMSILNLILGAGNTSANNYKGKINELTFWDKELSMVDIQTWMNKPLTASHPFYSNLLAYYKCDEATGLLINDSKNAQITNGVNFNWTYDRGDKLTRMFYETNIKPNVVFLRGVYSLTTNTLTVRDSIARAPSTVQHYSVVSNATVTPMAHDSIVLTGTTYSFEALAENIYDGDNNVLTGTIAVTPDGTLNINNLNYFERYPFYNEIMSFVTPYGKGLNLGVNGKTWYYDVTDFEPLLHGPKRMLMTLGGENQEQMDIDFYFIIGTPPRNVIEFNQLWQGTNRIGAASIGSINQNTKFEPLNVPMHPNGKYFKMRSTLTGHGSEGEFHQNGGTVTHSFNVNGGTPEFSWIITQECSMNPIYPQGGTWVYDRQGWCPGESSLVKQYDITPFVTPATTVTLDYDCSSPQVANGDYRYHAAHQLITYGNANHSIDANIIDVLSPSTKALYSRKNPMCSRPVILVQNTGSTTVSNIEIDYWLNTTTTKQTYTWTGTLAFMDTVSVYLPINTLWQNGMQTNNNIFNAEIKKVNGVVDDYVHNNTYRSAFEVPAQIPNYFAIEFKTNNYYTHNSYKILDDNDNVVAVSNFTAANTVFKNYYYLNGCYKFVVNDVGGDGLTWWANSAQGSGYIRLYDGQNIVLKSFLADFGGGFEYSFSTFLTTSFANQTFDSKIHMFPNPTKDKFILEGEEVSNSEIVIHNVLGANIDKISIGNNSHIEINTTNYTPGVYLVTISKGKESTTKKIVITN